MRVVHTVFLWSLALGSVLAQPSAPDPDQITVQKGINSISVQGGAGAAAAGATVEVIDGDGATAQGTAGVDGSFVISGAHLDLTHCTWVLARQRTSAEGDWSKTCAFHSDPPLIDFGTPDWETVYARFLYNQRPEAIAVDGRWVRVRPSSSRLRLLATAVGDAPRVEGAAGAVDPGAAVRITWSDGSTSHGYADDRGRFRLEAAHPRASRGAFLVSQRLGSIASRSTPLVLDGAAR